MHKKHIDITKVIGLLFGILLSGIGLVMWLTTMYNTQKVNTVTITEIREQQFEQSKDITRIKLDVALIKQAVTPTAINK